MKNVKQQIRGNSREEWENEHAQDDGVQNFPIESSHQIMKNGETARPSATR